MLSSPNTREVALIALAVLVLVVSGGDVVDDLGHGADRAHFALEIAMMVLAGGSMLALLRELASRGQELAALKRELAAAPVPVDADARALRHQLGTMIREQFAAWSLTTSEQEVGWLLLKGLSLKEIAAVRSTSEKTVRQQASAVYQKAGVAGRAAFAAWFIEDYLWTPPPGSGDAPDERPPAGAA